MANSLDPRQRRYVLKQTAISIGINSLIPTAIIWLVGVDPPASIVGQHGMLPGMLLASGLATTLMTAGVTMAVRADVRRGRVEPFAGVPPWPLPTLLPNWLPLRSVALGAAAICLLVPVGLGVIVSSGLLPLTAVEFVVWNLLFGAMVGLIMTPPAVARAMMERGVT